MTAKKDSARKVVLTADEFCFEQVTSEIVEEEKKDPIDQTALRYARDWSILANQIVGAEQY